MYMTSLLSNIYIIIIIIIITIIIIIIIYIFIYVARSFVCTAYKYVQSNLHINAFHKRVVVADIQMKSTLSITVSQLSPGFQ